MGFLTRFDLDYMLYDSNLISLSLFQKFVLIFIRSLQHLILLLPKTLASPLHPHLRLNHVSRLPVRPSSNLHHPLLPLETLLKHHLVSSHHHTRYLLITCLSFLPQIRPQLPHSLLLKRIQNQRSRRIPKPHLVLLRRMFPPVHPYLLVLVHNLPLCVSYPHRQVDL